MKLAIVLTSCLSVALQGRSDEPIQGLNDTDRIQIQSDLKDLDSRLSDLRNDKNETAVKNLDCLADADIFRKGVVWALRFENKLEPADVTLIQKALRRARQRMDALAKDAQPWQKKKGRLVRGYISVVDGSTQPFGLIVPASYDSKKPMRLDVVLHGSSKPTGLSELRFMNRFDDGDESAKTPPEADFIELHPLGRVENCYRWAGESDVFEAIEAVCRNYRIDRNRIVLRGMSMGASGTWHLGLKHPDRFVALGPYCGYVDTHNFSMTPLKNFIKVGELPAYQEKMLHMLDSIDYAANADIVPVIACMGEKDIFFQAHVLMEKAMTKEGLKMVNLISPGTGHVIDPVTHKEQMKRIGEYASKGLDHVPKHIRFVTWTLKYSRCHWLEVLGLEEHYSRAELDAAVKNDGSMEFKEPQNITRFAIMHPLLRGANPRLKVGGAVIDLPARDGKLVPLRVVIGRKEGKWAYLGSDDAVLPPGKQPGLQGPIDDAFTTPFLCVRGTGKAWNAQIHSWSEASLKRFAYEWSRYFRGDLPIKDDVDVTEDDMRKYNLILFGDPGSNSWIAKVLPKLPIEWTRDDVRIGKDRYAASDHVPSLIQLNPLAKKRYVVLNSGHTFHEKELASLNYLLFPRLGDWAILKVDGRIPTSPSDPLNEDVRSTDFFDAYWKVKENR